MEAGGNGIAESSYQVVSFPAAQLPEQYRNLILSKWLRTLKHGNDFFKLIQSDAYFKAYEAFIRSVLNRPRSVVRLAVLTEDKDVALGWSLIEGDILHYVYVQHDHRNNGIGKSLVPGKINVITHLTKAGMSAWHNKLPNAVFNPFA